MKAFFNTKFFQTVKKLFLIFGSTFAILLIFLGIIPIIFLGKSNVGNIAMILYGMILLLLIYCRNWVLNYKWVTYIKRSIAVLLIICFVVASVISCMMIKYGYFNRPEKGEEGVVVVLGCQVYGYSPSIMLKNRLDGALEFLNSNPQCKVIVCGGQGNDELCSEASVMANYLIENGVDESRIYMEEQSTNTCENIKFAKKIIEKENMPNTIFIVSDSFHLYRAGRFAKEEGLEYKGIPGKEYYPLFAPYWVREVLGVLHMIFIE